MLITAVSSLSRADCDRISMVESIVLYYSILYDNYALVIYRDANAS